MASMFSVFGWFFLSFQVFYLSPKLSDVIGIVLGMLTFGAIIAFEFRQTKKFMQMKDEIDKKWHMVHFPTEEMVKKFENLQQ
jgi:hypothetical protein